MNFGPLAAIGSQQSISIEGTLVLYQMEKCIQQRQQPPAEKVVDVEEGEISDSASSIEEISENDFRKQDPSNAAAATTTTVADASDSSSSDLHHPRATNANSENTINNHTTNNVKINSSGSSNLNSRIWTMRDLYKFRISGSYNSGLHNLAWASGVQNKPLNDFLVMELPVTTVDSNSGANANSAAPEGLAKNNSDNNGRVVIEVVDEGMFEGEAEKEEGELEEGEIDLGSEIVDPHCNNLSAPTTGDTGFEKGDAGSCNALDSILKRLQDVTLEYAQESFAEACGKVRNLLTNLLEMAPGNWLNKKENLIELSFTAIRTLDAVFHSMNQKQKEHAMESIRRLLVDLLNQKHPLFSTEQLKEIEGIVYSLDCHAIPSNSKAIDRNKEIQAADVFAKNSVDVSSQHVDRDVLINSVVDSIPPKLLDQSDTHYLKSGGANSKYRSLSLPLIDLHKDHDADSLPSPTRETTPCLPIVKGFGGILKPEWPIPRVSLETDKVPLHPYETDAVKAVSTYQQKFGRSSLFMNDRLPSPTPSEDGEDRDDDINNEVCSSTKRHGKPEGKLMMDQPIVSSISKIDNLSVPRPNIVQNATSLNSGPSSLLKHSSAKSRDPRLRLVNSEANAGDSILPCETKEPFVGIINPKKQKTVAEHGLDGPAVKRPRTELANSGIANVAQVVTGTGGWLEDSVPVGFKITATKSELGILEPRNSGDVAMGTSSNVSVPCVSADSNNNLSLSTPCSTASVQALLTDLAVNPSLLLSFLKGQQNFADPTKSTTQSASINSILGAVPSINLAAPKPTVLRQGSAGILQTPPQTASVEELGKLRMKPRDPRRVLHSSGLLTGGSIEIDQSQLKTTTLSTPVLTGNLNGQRQDHQCDKISAPLPSANVPDITLPFTENLKNLADILSVSQASSQPALPQIPSSQPAQTSQGRIDAKGVSDSGAVQTRSALVSKEVSAVSSRSLNNWDDVEHLFDGFDDQQKAAIHRERARRLEEQRKMFAARKLCLVLDLDHTLLNSAKFSEVDPVHDEILRKKEEQDREKPHRHLFRFPHMSMWTKLRPGIWNFLEKASKLYELHLYTMGNKLYATEMAKLLDPKGELFAGRVISRGDDGDLFDGDERVPKSKDLEGVLGMESAVVIIDDSVRVWPHNKLNLIVVERYIYFPCSRRQFGLPGPSLLEIDHDERPEDGTLASSLAVIERIHHNFFGHQSLDEADVRNILASEQQKILGGCRIVFSRVFPVGEANPHLHPLWQTAEQFGAVCTIAIDDQVTHVVANSLGTDKVNWALSSGRHVVHPGWVEASALLYRRANENDFAIKP